MPTGYCILSGRVQTTSHIPQILRFLTQ